MTMSTLMSRIIVAQRLLIFRFFPPPLGLIRDPTFIKIGIQKVTPKKIIYLKHSILFWYTGRWIEERKS